MNWRRGSHGSPNSSKDGSVTSDVSKVGDKAGEEQKAADETKAETSASGKKGVGTRKRKAGRGGLAGKGLSRAETATPEKVSKSDKHKKNLDSASASSRDINEDKRDPEDNNGQEKTEGDAEGSNSSSSTSSSLQQTSENRTGDAIGADDPESVNYVSPKEFQMPSYNSYQMYLNIRKAVEKRRKNMFPVTPKAPNNFKNYLLNRGSYLLEGRVQQQQNCGPQLPSKSQPPVSLKYGSPLFHLFMEQEEERQRYRVQHMIEKEKLRLSVEQEVLRVHGRAALAMANQSVPFSVCSILRDEEIYNTIDPEPNESDDPNQSGEESSSGSSGHHHHHRGKDGTPSKDKIVNEYSKQTYTSVSSGASTSIFADANSSVFGPVGSRSRYNGRLFLSWLQDVNDKWDKIKDQMVKRQKREVESLVAIQKLSWEWKMKELNLCDFKSTPIIEPSFIPMIRVEDDFDLLPSN